MGFGLWLVALANRSHKLTVDPAALRFHVNQDSRRTYGLIQRLGIPVLEHCASFRKIGLVFGSSRRIEHPVDKNFIERKRIDCHIEH